MPASTSLAIHGVSGTVISQSPGLEVLRIENISSELGKTFELTLTSISFWKGSTICASS